MDARAVDNTEIITTDDVERITLPSGDTLDTRQSLACVLEATTSLSHTQIALACGYSAPSAVSRFLRSPTGQAGVRAALEQRLNRAGKVGLDTLISVAEDKKAAANARVAAASKLVEIAKLQAAGEPGETRRAGDGGVNIQINLPGTSPDSLKTIPAELSPDTGGEGGRGKNRG